MTVELRVDRFLSTARFTLGRLHYPGGRCFTLEDPWLNNARSISCIPEGHYKLARDTFRGRYANFKLLDVPERDAIEIHRGNTTRDTQGCLLVGRRVMMFEDGEPCLQESAGAMNHFMLALSKLGDDFELVIRGGGEP